ncbi:MAG: hypothetical protein KBS75_08175, partial [Bacteroidales bacterium]|nr:hypothetical protein [Candidatus Equimonas faecalis]
MRRKSKVPGLFCASLALIALGAGCQSISCPLDNVVALKVALYDGGESPFTSADTLSVEALGTDSVLINRLTNFKDFPLPLKMTGGGEGPATFLLHWVAKGHAERAAARP